MSYVAPHDGATQLATRADLVTQAAGAAALVLALAVLTFDQGGYWPEARIVPGLLLLLSLGAATRRASAHAKVPAVLLWMLGALTCWTIPVGIATRSWGCLWWPAMLAALLAVVYVCRAASAFARLILEWGILALGVAVAASSWLGLIAHATPWAFEAEGVWQGATALTYSNAGGAFIGALVTVALGKLLSAPTRALDVSLTILLIGLGSMLSRGAILATVLAVGLLGRQVGYGDLWARLRRPLIGAAFALICLIPATIGADRVTSVSVGTMGLGVALLLVLTTGVSQRLSLALLAIGALVCVATTDVKGLLQAPSPRLGLRSPERVHEMVETIERVRSAPVFGQGSSDLNLRWHVDGEARVAIYAHNEYLQTAAEIGLFGFAIIAVVAWVLMRMLSTGASLSTSQSVAAHAAVVGFLVHSAADFLWHVPAVLLVVSALVGLYSEPSNRPGEELQVRAQPVRM